eukprot:10441337-Karenia_brevis.AAC.1
MVMMMLMTMMTMVLVMMMVMVPGHGDPRIFQSILTELPVPRPHLRPQQSTSRRHACRHAPMARAPLSPSAHISTAAQK